MGDYADDEIFGGLDQQWGGGRYLSLPPKRTNAQIFRRFTGPDTEHPFKVGDRVKHRGSGQKGTVMEVLQGRAYVGWRPDSRIKPGGVLVDISHLDKLLDYSQF